MPVNTCRVIFRKNDKETASEGILCTNDVELHVLMLTCSR
jgi:hypothetical protein